MKRAPWTRRLDRYPGTPRRYLYLALVVLATVSLYYQLYVQGAVATQIMAHYGMTFRYFVFVSVAGNAVGAFSSLLAGFADRWGRANMVVHGLLVTGLLVAFVQPYAPTRGAYLATAAAVGFVEGVVLVASSALVRDFSPQLGRASAMGFWTMGPVLGSLVLTLVAGRTLDAGATWQDELRYAGYGALVLFVPAFLLLRELGPALRGRVLVSARDAAEAPRARPAAGGGWRRMLGAGVIVPALGISAYLLIYYAAVGFAVVYFATVYGYTAAQANTALNWYWIANAAGLVAAGVLSDRLRARRPFMVAGAVASIAATAAFALTATHPGTAPRNVTLLLAAIGVTTGLAYAPWMAAFTESVERRDPAAVATGLAVWGWVLRAFVAVSAACLPLVVPGVTPLVAHGAEVREALRKAGPAAVIVQAHPDLFAELGKYGFGQAPAGVNRRAMREVGLKNLLLVEDHAAELAVLEKYGPEVRRAQAETPGRFRLWWWICVAGQVAFLPTLLLLRRPRTSPAVPAGPAVPAPAPAAPAGVNVRWRDPAERPGLRR